MSYLLLFMHTRQCYSATHDSALMIADMMPVSPFQMKEIEAHVFHHLRFLFIQPIEKSECRTGARFILLATLPDAILQY